MAAAFAGTVLFAGVLARVTLEPSAVSAGLVHGNVRPGASIRAHLDAAPAREAAEQLGGNLLLGVPFGVLLPVLLPRTRGLLRLALATAVVMTLVELVQGALVTGRGLRRRRRRPQHRRRAPRLPPPRPPRGIRRWGPDRSCAC
ncbi:VanZ family protein [Streptomyces sp. NPDC059104]|uniref:VanZ family protein n=1 Tax=Streptomyces sp. NPDC059104 TaxID=3346729 RepID=UPI003681C3E9